MVLDTKKNCLVKNFVKFCREIFNSKNIAKIFSWIFLKLKNFARYCVSILLIIININLKTKGKEVKSFI